VPCVSIQRLSNIQVITMLAKLSVISQTLGFRKELRQNRIELNGGFAFSAKQSMRQATVRLVGRLRLRNKRRILDLLSAQSSEESLLLAR
jgi:hypothetical protein